MKKRQRLVELIFAALLVIAVVFLFGIGKRGSAEGQGAEIASTDAVISIENNLMNSEPGAQDKFEVPESPMEMKSQSSAIEAGDEEKTVPEELRQESGSVPSEPEDANLQNSPDIRSNPAETETGVLPLSEGGTTVETVKTGNSSEDNNHNLPDSEEKSGSIDGRSVSETNGTMKSEESTEIQSPVPDSETGDNSSDREFSIASETKETELKETEAKGTEAKETEQEKEIADPHDESKGETLKASEEDISAEAEQTETSSEQEQSTDNDVKIIPEENELPIM